MDIDTLLRKAVQMGASDIHLAPGAKPMARINGSLRELEEAHLLKEDIEKTMERVVPREDRGILAEKGEFDCSYPSMYGRCRVNFFKERRGLSAAFRIVGSDILSLERLGLPPVADIFCGLKKGLVLVTGPTGSGKSTTLASMIDRINTTREGHIITLEDPVEYIHKHKKCVISQREITKDSIGFPSALRSALRQDPDVILVGEMRDLETISTAITAAETGHLVLSTLHTSGAAKTVDRIIDVFPPHQQAQVRLQLSMVLEGIISQQLLPKADESGREGAFEVMTGTPAIRNLIREGKTHMLQNQIQTGSGAGMRTMDGAILKLFENKKITRETALAFAHDREAVLKEMTMNLRLVTG